MIRLFRTPVLVAVGLFVLPYSALAQAEPGKGSLGGSVGVPLITGDDFLRGGIKPRAMGKFHFQYVFTDRWRLSIRGGFGWTGYSGDVAAPFPLQGCCGTVDSTKVDQLTTLVPVSAVLVYTRPLNESWTLFGGLGPGFYRWNILNDRKTVHDPITFERFRTWDPGFTAELGGEYFLPANRDVSFELLSTYNFLFSQDVARFPSGYHGNHSFLDFSFGVNVYFGIAVSEPEPTTVFGEEPAESPESPAEPAEQPDAP